MTPQTDVKRSSDDDFLNSAV